jgi:hypothetical protein
LVMVDDKIVVGVVFHFGSVLEVLLTAYEVSDCRENRQDDECDFSWHFF